MAICEKASMSMTRNFVFNTSVFQSTVFGPKTIFSSASRHLNVQYTYLTLQWVRTIFWAVTTQQPINQALCWQQAVTAYCCGQDHQNYCTYSIKSTWMQFWSSNKKCSITNSKWELNLLFFLLEAFLFEEIFAQLTTQLLVLRKHPLSYAGSSHTFWHSFQSTKQYKNVSR